MFPLSYTSSTWFQGDLGFPLERAVAEIWDIEPHAIFLRRLVRDEARKHEARCDPCVDRRLLANIQARSEVVCQERVTAFMAVRFNPIRERGSLVRSCTCETPSLSLSPSCPRVATISPFIVFHRPKELADILRVCTLDCQRLTVAICSKLSSRAEETEAWFPLMCAG